MVATSPGEIGGRHPRHAAGREGTEDKLNERAALLRRLQLLADPLHPSSNEEDSVLGVQGHGALPFIVPCLLLPGTVISDEREYLVARCRTDSQIGPPANV